mgnify:CR=1 FL=1
MQSIMGMRKEPPLKKPKVAIISSYGNNCGMSTYTKYLTTAMKPKVQDIRIFAEYMDGVSSNDEVVRCWDRSKGMLYDIIPEIIKYNPDVVFIQHEYGQINNPVQWNLLVGHLSSLVRTVVVLHSVYDHKDKLVFEAPCNEIIVHSVPGRELLQSKGVGHATIHYIPHGCLPPEDMDLKWSSLNKKPVIFQFGFGFEYKGWSNANDIVEALKSEFPEIAYIGVFNMSRFSYPMQLQYYVSLMNNIRDRNLQNNVVLHKGFRSEDILFSYMKQSKINLFPYWNHPEWRVYGASGAVRLALASGTPTIVGDVPFFHEFKGYIPVCGTTQEYVAQISRLLTDQKYREEVQKRMLEFIDERTWDKVASWYLECDPSKPFTAPIPGVSP